MIRGLTDDVWNIVEACWIQDPTKRLTVEQVVERLGALPYQRLDQRPHDHFNIPSRNHPEHPFFTLSTTKNVSYPPQPLVRTSLSRPGDRDDLRQFPPTAVPGPRVGSQLASLPLDQLRALLVGIQHDGDPNTEALASAHLDVQSLKCLLIGERRHMCYIYCPEPNLVTQIYMDTKKLIL
jgi:hypothetical protein